jgi:hypothetical protein
MLKQISGKDIGMRFFQRRPQSRFPDDMMGRLELLGRFGMDPTNGGIDAGEIWSRCHSPFLSDAKSDPNGFVADLRSCVAGDSGFASYGASQLVVELLGYELRTPDALALMDGGIAFKRARGLPSAHLTVYELQRWLEINDSGPW